MANDSIDRTESTHEQENLTTAQLAKRSTRAEENVAPVTDTHVAMFPSADTESFRTSWHQIQADFVDSPRESVKKADELVASIIQRVAEVFAAERSKLEGDWGEGRDVSTEDLRQALQRYRSFFDRLLSL
jgi:hypothetical protein